MAVSGIDLAVGSPTILLTLAGATGMLGATGTDVGPFLALEQARLTQSVSEVGRTVDLELAAGLGHANLADPGKQGYTRREKTVSLNHTAPSVWTSDIQRMGRHFASREDRLVSSCSG
jgi:hypothetical protein